MRQTATDIWPGKIALCPIPLNVAHPRLGGSVPLLPGPYPRIGDFPRKPSDLE
jgi:hypothetical protein